MVTLTREAGLNCKCFALCDCDFTLFDLQHCHASPLGSRSGANIAPLRHALSHGSLQPAHAMRNAAMLQEPSLISIRQLSRKKGRVKSEVQNPIFMQLSKLA